MALLLGCAETCAAFANPSDVRFSHQTPDSILSLGARTGLSVTAVPASRPATAPQDVLGLADLAAADPVDGDRVERDDRQDHDPAIEQESQRCVRRREAPKLRTLPVFRRGLLAEAKRVDHLGPFVRFRSV